MVQQVLIRGKKANGVEAPLLLNELGQLETTAQLSGTVTIGDISVSNLPADQLIHGPVTITSGSVNVGTLGTITNKVPVGTVDTVTGITNKIMVDTVDAITSITNKVPVGTVDTVAAVTSITNKVPVGTVDTVTNVGTVGTVTNKVPVGTVDTLTTITNPVLTNKTSSTTHIVSNTTIGATVTSADIDVTNVTNFALLYKLSAGTGGTPTLTITLQVKDSAGNYINDTDYATAALAASTSGIGFKGYLEGYTTCRITATLGGSGTFTTGCNIDFVAKS